MKCMAFSKFEGRAFSFKKMFVVGFSSNIFEPPSPPGIGGSQSVYFMLVQKRGFSDCKISGILL